MQFRPQFLQTIDSQVDLPELGQSYQPVGYLLQLVVVQPQDLQRLQTNYVALADLHDLVVTQVHVFEFLAFAKVRHGCEMVVAQF